MFQSKKIWFNVPWRKIWSKNYSTKKIYVKRVILDITCRARCSNTCFATSGPCQQTNIIAIVVKSGVLQHLDFVNRQMLFQLWWRRDTCGTRCSNMCATYDPDSTCEFCYFFGAKLWLRFNQICCDILEMHLCNLFDSYWGSNQFKCRFKF